MTASDGSGKSRPSDKEISDALRESAKLISEEGERWKRIHGDPSRDEVSLTENKDNYTITVVIDSGVDNIINSQPISREYIIPKDDDAGRGLFGAVIKHSNLYFVGGINSKLDLDIGILAGYHPPFMYDFGIGPLLTTGSISCMVFYSGGKWDMRHVIMGMAIGSDYSGIVANYMIGVMF